MFNPKRKLVVKFDKDDINVNISKIRNAEEATNLLLFVKYELYDFLKNIVQSDLTKKEIDIVNSNMEQLEDIDKQLKNTDVIKKGHIHPIEVLGRIYGK